MIYNDYKLPFDRILKLLVTKIYEFQAGLTPPIVSDGVTYLSPGKTVYVRNFQSLEFSHKRTVTFGTENFFLKGTSNLEPDPGKIKDIISNIKKKKLKRNNNNINKENRCVMPANVEYAKREFNIMALLTKNCNVFFSRTQLHTKYLNTTSFSFY